MGLKDHSLFADYLCQGLVFHVGASNPCVTISQEQHVWRVAAQALVEQQKSDHHHLLHQRGILDPELSAGRLDAQHTVLQALIEQHWQQVARLAVEAWQQPSRR